MYCGLKFGKKVKRKTMRPDDHEGEESLGVAESSLPPRTFGANREEERKSTETRRS
jgi:hypothetical protein